jgi:hypothetical protein
MTSLRVVVLQWVIYFFLQRQKSAKHFYKIK